MNRTLKGWKNENCKNINSRIFGRGHDFSGLPSSVG
jgi:hypothetical protein